MSKANVMCIMHERDFCKFILETQDVDSATITMTNNEVKSENINKNHTPTEITDSSKTFHSKS